MSILSSLLGGDGGSALETGAIIIAQLADPGSGYVGGLYQNVPLVNIQSSGSGAKADVEVGNGGISSVSLIDNKGNGGSAAATYNNVDVVTLSGTGSGAEASVITAYRGQINTLTIETPGIGGIDGIYYNIVPILAPPLVGTGLLVKVEISGGVLTAVEVAEKGEGYLAGATFSFDPVDVGGLTGATIEADALVTYTIDRIVITEGGEGYEAGDNLTFNAADIGGVTSVLFTPKVIAAGEVYRIRLTENGVGYENNDTFTVNNSNLGNSGSGLVLMASLCFNTWVYR